MMKRTQLFAAAALGLLLSGACAEDNPLKVPPPGEGGVDCTVSTLGYPVLRRLTAEQLDHTVRDVFPQIESQWTGPRLGQAPLSDLGFSNDNEALLVGSQAAKEILQTAEDVAKLVTEQANLPVVLPCAATSPDEACAQSFIEGVGRRLFRRPLSDSEVASYQALYASVAGASDFVYGIKWTLVALMQSPHAIYRSELGVAEGDEYVLTGRELASELSYTYAGSPPSQELVALGESGALFDPAVRVEQARALIETPRGREMVQRFVEEWIHYTLIRGKAREDVADFATIADLMIDETRGFIDEVLFEQRGGVSELLTADYSLPSTELAAFYGWQGADGNTPVSRPAEWGVGLLSQGSFLASHAHMGHSSPTLRGLVVYRRFLCKDIPPPPADVPPFEPPEAGEMTTRERFEEVHIANEACKSCHIFFDPPGFAFEHFDETGRYRADENGLSIDDSGQVLFDDTKHDVLGQSDLATTLAEHEQVSQCLTRLIAAYSHGGEDGSQCSLTTPRQALAEGSVGIVGYWASLAGTDHFARRDLK